MKLGRFISITDIDQYVTEIFDTYEITYEGLHQAILALTTLADHIADPSAHFSNVVNLTFVIDGGGSAITTGVKGFLPVDFACSLQQATILADQSGSIVVDIWKDTYANFPPTDDDSITASAPLTINGAQKAQDGTLTGWTKAVAAGDILAFNVDSCATITWVVIDLKAVKA